LPPAPPPAPPPTDVRPLPTPRVLDEERDTVRIEPARTSAEREGRNKRGPLRGSAASLRIPLGTASPTATGNIQGLNQ
jgi:hypothetical protein